MDALLGAYASGDEEDGDEKEPSEPLRTVPASSGLISTAPEPLLEQQTQQTAGTAVRGRHLSLPLVGSSITPEQVLGPARPPPRPVADESEVPAISQPGLWSQLPAPTAPVRRVVQLQLPLHKSLLQAAGADDSDEEAGRAGGKGQARPQGSAHRGAGIAGKLMAMLPPPKNEARPRSRGSLHSGGIGAPSSQQQQQQQQQGETQATHTPQILTSEAYRVDSVASAQGHTPGVPGHTSSGPGRGGPGGPGGSGSLALSRRGGAAAAVRGEEDEDEEDLDVMAVLGPMPEAGDFAAGPIADEEGDEGEEEGARPGPAHPAGPGPSRQSLQGGRQHHPGHAYLTNPDPDAGQGGGGRGPGTSSQYLDAHHGSAQYHVAYAGAVPQQQGGYGQQQQGGGEEDVGRLLFEQALAEEEQRAQKKGKITHLAGIQFKEVNAKDLTYMNPAAKAAAQNVRASLGSEYAGQLRAEARPHEGNKMAKRKHQIGTLFANAKLKELELLEGKAAGMRSKKETQAKYGW
ncbi:hypothetical protein V8C86DRAFT_420317 [Haematococcus lacustris]